MSSLVKFAKSELRSAGLFDPDADFDGTIAPSVVSLMETFTAYGHSGGSAKLALDAFTRLANHLPLSPLTGEDDEWFIPDGVTSTQIQLNKRCTRIAKDDEMAWDVTKGRKPITFPYMPE